MRPEVGKNWLLFFRDFFNPRAESKVFEQIEISQLVYIFTGSNSSVFHCTLPGAKTAYKRNTRFLGKNSQGLAFAFSLKWMKYINSLYLNLF